VSLIIKNNKLMNKNNKLLQEEIKRILFISNYNLNNPPKIIKENYYDQQEIEYSKIEKENEKGYPANHQYENEYMIDEQPAGKKPVGRPPKKEPAAAPSAGEVPELPPIDNKLLLILQHPHLCQKHHQKKRKKNQKQHQKVMLKMLKKILNLLEIIQKR